MRTAVLAVLFTPALAVAQPAPAASCIEGASESFADTVSFRGEAKRRRCWITEVPSGKTIQGPVLPEAERPEPKVFISPVHLDGDRYAFAAFHGDLATGNIVQTPGKRCP